MTTALSQNKCATSHQAARHSTLALHAERHVQQMMTAQEANATSTTTAAEAEFLFVFHSGDLLVAGDSVSF